MRRSLLLFVSCLAIAACHRAPQDGDSRQADTTADPAMPPSPTASAQAPSNSSAIVADTVVPEDEGAASRDAGPNIGTHAAPDVAFTYRYGFRLAAARIAEIQDQHQALCERYTTARCRITGMTYRAVNADDVEATLTFNLDPAISRQFSHDAVQRVTGAEGSVTESEINGNDVGTSIRATGRNLDQLQAELQRVEGQRGSAGNDRKPQLDYEATQLREQIAALTQARETQQDTLATTPMIFRYGSGRFAPGPAQEPSLREAAQQTGESALYGFYLVARILIALLPWILLGLLGWWTVTRLHRRWSARADTEEPTAS